MGANKNGQRIMCSVICTPNRENPSAYVPAHLREHPAVQSQYRCGNGGRRSRTRTAQYDPCTIYTQVYDTRRKEIRKQMSKELYK